MSTRSVAENKTENRVLAIFAIFLVILGLGFLGWYSYLYFRPGFAPMGATTSYAGSGDSSTLSSKESRGEEISSILSIKYQRSEYQHWPNPFHFETQYHYEILISVPSGIEYFTVDNLTLRLSYQTIRAYDESSSLPKNGTLIDDGKSVLINHGHIDFPVEASEEKLTSLYLSYDEDAVGKAITKPLPGNTLKVSILADSAVTSYSAA